MTPALLCHPSCSLRLSRPFTSLRTALPARQGACLQPHRAALRACSAAQQQGAAQQQQPQRPEGSRRQQHHPSSGAAQLPALAALVAAAAAGWAGPALAEEAAQEAAAAAAGFGGAAVEQLPPTPENFLISALFTVAIGSLTVVTLGVAYLSYGSWMDSRAEEEDRKKVAGLRPLSSGTGAAGAAGAGAVGQQQKKAKKQPQVAASSKGFGKKK